MFFGLLLAITSVFSSPIADSILLAGNFGEPRPHHFHGGIDLKTGGVEGVAVLSVGNGYVSSISIDARGYGNALTIHHPEGYESFYCHLKCFTPQIERLLKNEQARNRRYSGEFRLRPTDCPVAKGQFIALSGNSGASHAPHLHFEIHDASNGDLLDPLDFLPTDYSDQSSPVLHRVMAYPRPGQGVFCGTPGKTIFPVLPSNRILTAWGRVGFAIWANDYMTGTYHWMGVRKTELYVDDRLVCSSELARIPLSKNRMVDYWGDYAHYYRNGVWYLKSFTEEGAQLPFIVTGPDQGWIDFREERDYRLKYVLTDVSGNSSTYRFIVRGTRSPLPVSASTDSPWQLHGRVCGSIQLPGIQLDCPEHSLPTRLSLTPKITFKEGAISPTCRFHYTHLPLIQWARLSILCRDTTGSRQFYLRGEDGKAYGCGFSNGWVHGRVRELGQSYEVARDDSPPVIRLLSAQDKPASGIMFTVSDKGSGLDDVRLYIDGRYAVCRRRDKSNVFVCELAHAPVRSSSRPHDLLIEATDLVGNRSHIRTTIKH